MHHPQTKPLVTVVTAVRNLVRAGRSAAVIECLESVHQQDYPQIEHLVIDGASDDGTLELLRPYETKGWIKIYSEADNGLYDAFNKGLARASGKYINFMNSDDHFIEDRAVSLSVKRLEESSRSCIRVGGGLDYEAGISISVAGRSDTDSCNRMGAGGGDPCGYAVMSWYGRIYRPI